ncbi:MAG TPA: endo-1,4-beta-xylanase, partial [Actinomycetota bacterium]|nr:endo-1,4-beta-xylanase [Actinomycetota bacterium]
MITRRRLLAGAAGAGLVAAAGCTGDRQDGGSARPGAQLRACDEETGVVYGSSAATWQLSDAAYRRLFAREADILFTEDDLLWYRVRPTPEAEIDFSYADKIVRFAERNDMLVFGAHLVWDEGFGEGWTEEDLWGMDESTARRMLFGTLEQLVRRYRGRIDAWSVVNEAIGTDGSDGLRTDVPWYASLGPTYVAESFRRARDNDPDAVLVLNEFGFETVDD